MVWAPARPSPTAAPMAPPPRARPPPTMAPAVLIADTSSGSAATVSPRFGAPGAEPRVCCSVPRAGDRTVCSSRALEARKTVPLVFLLLQREAEVQDREQGEDEGLDRPDDQVETLPQAVREPQQPGGDQPDDGEHHAAGEDVAEESQGEGERLDDLADDLQRD